MLLFDLTLPYVNNQLLLKISQRKTGFRCSIAEFTQGTCSSLPSCRSQWWKSHFEASSINHSRTTLQAAQELRFPRMFPDFCALVTETHMFTWRSGDSSKVDKFYQTWFSGTNIFVIFFFGSWI